MTSTTTIPNSIQKLISDVEALGGAAPRYDDRNLWSISIPINYVGGVVHQLNIGNVGFYIQDNGRPMVSGVAKLRREIALRSRYIPKR